MGSVSPTLCATDGAAEPPGMDLRRVGGMDPIGQLKSEDPKKAKR
jgi:hypothetical protein